MRYRLEFKPGADRDLSSIPEQPKQRILRKISGLATNPRPRGVKKLPLAQELHSWAEAGRHSSIGLRSTTPEPAVGNPTAGCEASSAVHSPPAVVPQKLRQVVYTVELSPPPFAWYLRIVPIRQGGANMLD